MVRAVAVAQFRMHSVDRENEIAEGLELERKLLTKYRRGRDPHYTPVRPFAARDNLLLDQHYLIRSSDWTHGH